MVTTQDAILAWLSDDVQRVVRQRAKEDAAKKKFKDRPDTDSNSDENSADNIAMEKVSRAYVDRKNKSDDKDQRKAIDESIEQAKRPKLKPIEEQPEGSVDTAPTATPVPQVAQEPIVDKVRPKLKPVLPLIDAAPITPTEAQTIAAPEAVQAEDAPVPLDQLDVTSQAAPNAVPQLSTPTATLTMPELSVEPAAPMDQDKKDALKQLDVAPAGSAPVPQPLPEAASKVEMDAGGFDDLSGAFQEAASRPISVAGINVPAGTAAYDAAETSQRLLASANSSIPALPMLSRRLGAYLFKPYDMVAGTKLFDKHNQTTDQMENFIRGTGLVKEPETFAERAAFALGSVAIPFPGAGVAAAGKAGITPAKQLIAEAMLPGTILRPGASMAATYAASATGALAINEGLYQVLDRFDKLNKINPPVPNSVGDVEPRVTSVPAEEAKSIQQKMNLTTAQFTKMFAEASYSDIAITSIAGLAAVAYAARGARNMFARSVEQRTIRDPNTVTPDLSPQSVTTPAEALRTMGQNSAHVLESQARRAGNNDLALDITTQTRAGANARMDFMHETGNIEIPGYQFQLTTSPKALIDAHLARPVAEQRELDWAFATMDQVDHATVQGLRRSPNATGGPGMPAQGDIQRAQAVLAQPANQPFVQAMSEMREAILGSAEAMGRFNAQAAQDLRVQRPNYAHIIETGDYVVENGVSRPMTRWEQLREGLNNKAKQVNEGASMPQDLTLANERTQVSGPNQRLSPIISNVLALREAAEFGLQNDIKQRFVDSISNDPALAMSVRRLGAGQNAPHGSGLVSVWRGGAEERYALPTLTADALNFDPFRSQRVLSTVKNVNQSLITGTFAPWYAFTSATMEAGLGSITRLRGTRLGWIDQSLQAVSGGRLALPGDMLGTAAAMVQSGFRTVRANNVMHATQALERAIIADPTLQVNQLNGALGGKLVSQVSRGIALGHNVTTQDLVDNGRRIYAESAKGHGNRIGALHSSSNEMMRNVSEFNSQNTRDAFLRELGAEQGGTIYKTFQRYLNAVRDVHDYAKFAYIDANRGRVPDNVLANETRNLGGDLGKRGLGLGDTGYNLADNTTLAGRMATKAIANRVVGSGVDLVRDSTNYYNPHIQGVSRVLEAFARQPSTTMMGITAGITTPYVASLAWANMLGPEYVDYLMNRREEWRKTNYLYFGIPGKPPEEGANTRIDPALSVFGYPVLEALDSVFGIRKYNAAKMGQQPIPEEAQGVASAISDGLKEFAGIGFPWPVQMAMAGQGVAVKNMLDPGFSRSAERLSGTGGSGQYSSSALSLSSQMMLESIVGVVGKAGIHALDAWVSTDKGSSYLTKAGNAAKQASYDLGGEMPVAPKFFNGSKPAAYSEGATALAQGTRTLLSAGRKIVKAIEIERNQLLRTKGDQVEDEGGMAVPNLKLGYTGEVKIPDAARQQFDAIKQLIDSKGELQAYYTERKNISDGLSGLRAINAGNIGRQVIVPLKDGAIGGVNYLILSKEKLKEEGVAEQYSIDNPTMTKGSAPGAKRYVAPKEAANQRPKPLKDRLSNVPTKDDINAMRAPTLAEVSRLQNMLNKRRYDLDKGAAASINELQNKNGFKLVDLAKSIQLSTSGNDADDTED